MKAIAAAAPFAERRRSEDDDERSDRLRPLELDGDDGAHGDDDRSFDNAMVRCVLSFGPNLSLRDAAGLSASDWARKTGNHAAMALLERFHAQQIARHADVAQRQQRQSECEALLRAHDELLVQMEALLGLPTLQENEMLELLDAIPQTSRASEWNARNETSSRSRR
ncbi:hypothetical protein PINS_up012691 [Pythium insidiosum]|nr:hypothetical protein PINS_up012691 [Pythium insidiosum]